MTTPATDEDMSELVDATFPRVDLVGKAANGVPRFLVVKSDDSAGLLDASYVRDLISESEPESEQPMAPAAPGVTVSGSAAEVAAFIHKAAQRAAEPVAKAELKGSERSDLPDSAFAYIEAGGHKEDGKTRPDKLRHFPLHDESHVRSALSQAPKSPFGDKAMPKIRAAAKKLGIEVSKALAEAGLAEAAIAKALALGGDDIDDGIDSLDPTVPLAEPEGDAPGDPAEPGSPAWEAIDAATAQKWISIAARLRNALGVLADRETIEAACADPDDIGAAWDLQDAQRAVDYVISTLAVFAAGEQNEADLAAESMDSIAKALGSFDVGPLETVEGLAPVAKAGRVLSAVNEGRIKDAAASLQQVLATLPSAPQADDSGQPAAKQKESPMGDTTTQAEPEAAVKAAADAQPAASEPEPAPAAGVAKADGDGSDGDSGDDGGSDGDGALVPVYDRNGTLCGVCKPSDVMAVKDTGKADGAPPAHDAAGHDDMTPQPPGDAGTPADAVKAADAEPAADEGGTQDQPGSVAKSEPPAAESEQSGTVTVGADVLKGIADGLLAVTAALGSTGPAQDVAKMADVAVLARQVEALGQVVKQIGEQPAYPKVALNGATPPQHMMRGQDRAPAGVPQVDIAKAAELKSILYHGSGPEQKAAADRMQQMAVAAFTELHRR